MSLEPLPVDDREARRRINCAVRRLDASKIAIVMNVVGWHWAAFGRAPKPDEIRRVARRLLAQSWQFLTGQKAESWTTRTGGLQATWQRNGEVFDCYLSFELAWSDSEYCDDE
jgi:hypothetical protein